MSSFDRGGANDPVGGRQLSFDVDKLTMKLVKSYNDILELADVSGWLLHFSWIYLAYLHSLLVLWM